MEKYLLDSYNFSDILVIQFMPHKYRESDKRFSETLLFFNAIITLPSQYRNYGYPGLWICALDLEILDFFGH